MKNPIRKRLASKAFKKIKGAMPDLKEFAVENDKGYMALIKVIQEINDRRKKLKKFVIHID